jgi:hypothetical protein
MRSVLAHQQRARSGGRNVGGMLLVNKTNRSAGRRTDCGWLLQRRARMRKSLAAALMPFIFAYVAPAFAADPTDARLMADVAVAKATITLLQSRDFTAVRDRFQPALGPLPDDVLAGMADVIAGEAKSVETISSKGTFNPATGNGESQTILEYQIGLRWVVADVVVKTENNIKRVSGLYFSTNSQPLRELSVFHLSGKGFAQYAFLAGWIGIIADRLGHGTGVSPTFRLVAMGSDDRDAAWTWAGGRDELEQRRILDLGGARHKRCLFFLSDP